MATGLHNIPISASTARTDCRVVPSREARAGIRSGRGRRHSLAEKLAARLEKSPDGCWNVRGCRANRAGHVHISQGSPGRGDYTRIYAHKLAWELAHNQKVPAGLVVMHRCDNPRCANPDHLSLGTQSDNIHDSIRKGRYNTFGRQRLNAEQVLQIRDLAAQGVPQREIARSFGVARNTVSGIVHRRSWAHLKGGC